MNPLRSKMMMLAILTTLVGCTTVQVSQDYDPDADLARYRTWQWREPIQASAGDVRADNPLLNKRIRRAVENHLTSRQIKATQGQPDFYLAYRLSIVQKIQGDSYYSTVGVGSYYHPWYGGYGGLGSETIIRQYEESRLTIDMLAADTKDLLWRGTGIFRFKTYATPEEAAEAMQQTVDRILWQFPPQDRP